MQTLKWSRVPFATLAAAGLWKVKHDTPVAVHFRTGIQIVSCAHQHVLIYELK